MPLHVFRRRDTGEEVERFYHSTERIPKVLTAGLPKGVRADRIIAFGRKHDALQGDWPVRSDALAYHPDQVTPELKKHLGCDIDPDGRPVLENPQHRRKVLRRVGAVDRSGYY